MKDPRGILFFVQIVKVFFFVSRSRHQCNAHKQTHKVTKTVPTSINPNEFEREVLLSSKDGEVGIIAKSDNAILSLGRSLCRGERRDKKKTMAAMHLMARYIRNLRNISKSTNASGEEMILPFNWEFFKDSILCGKAHDSVELNASATITNTLNALQADHAMQNRTAARLQDEQLQRTAAILKVKGRTLFASSWREYVAKLTQAIQKLAQGLSAINRKKSAF